MGQKVHPTGFRIGPLFQWISRWYANDQLYGQQVFEDLELRKYIESKLANAGITKVEIERSINNIHLLFHVARPGVVIGRGGTTLTELQKTITDMVNTKTKSGRKMSAAIDVVQVENPDLEAKLVALRIADQLINRYPQRRAVGQAMDRVRQAGAKGVKIQLSGRIGGAEISRREKYSQGTVPSQTLRSDISYAHVPALTKSGYIGVKVWINRGEKEA